MNECKWSANIARQDTCDAEREREGHYYAGGEEEGGGCRQTENLHRYPMKDNRAFAIAFDVGREGGTDHFTEAQTIDKPYQGV